MNGTHTSNCPSASTAEKKIGATFAYYLMFIVSLTGNIVIGIIVYKTKTMRRPTNFFIVNMAMSYLLYPIFVIPRGIQRLYIGPVHTNPFSKENGAVLLRIRLSSTLQ